MTRRNFTRNQREQIVERAKDADGTIRCEKCGLAVKPGQFEIDHILAEALRPEADKQKPITIAEGQLLGIDCCHRGERGKTNDDVKKIAKAKRQNAKHLGITTPKQKIPGRGFGLSEHKAKRLSRTTQSLPPKRLFLRAEEID